MHKNLQSGLLLAGLIIPFWLVAGIFLASQYYPGYNHYQDALSLLGAQGAETEALSPLINNYPLGVLFSLFGLGLYRMYSHSTPAKISAGLIILHGIGSISAGVFACDASCLPNTPSTSQIIHNLSGLIMSLSLICAACLWKSLSVQLLGLRWLSHLAFLSALVSLVTIPLMIIAIQHGGFGLFQRINYGASILWMSALSGYLFFIHTKPAKSAPVDNSGSTIH